MRMSPRIGRTFRYVYATCMKGKGINTMDHATWELLLGNFDCLARGEDENGQPIYVDAAGIQWKFVLVFGGGDMEQFVFGWGLKSYNDTDELCGLCLANRSDRPYTNMQVDSEWRPTCPLSEEVFLRSC